MWQLMGQTRVVSLLQHGLEKGTLAHAYLLVGPPHVGKMTLALNLAQARNCPADEPPCGQCPSCQRIASAKHADVQVIGLAQGPEEDKAQAEISIEQIRQLQHSANLPPFEGRCKVFIIDGAEFMSNEAANCLLKTLEEPAERVTFILLTAAERALPATVISRCQRLELTPLPAAAIEAELINQPGIEPEKARLLARLCHGCPGRAFSAAADDGWLRQRAEQMETLTGLVRAGYEERFDYAAQLAKQFSRNRAAVQEILGLWLDFWRDLMLIKAGGADNITNVDLEARLIEIAGDYSLAEIRTAIGNIQAAEAQLRLNANPRLALEVLMLNIPRKEKRSGHNGATPLSVKHG